MRVAPELLDEVAVSPVGAVAADSLRLGSLAVCLEGDDVAGAGFLELDAEDGGVDGHAAEHAHREGRVAELGAERVDAAHEVLVEGRLVRLDLREVERGVGRGDDELLHVLRQVVSVLGVLGGCVGVVCHVCQPPCSLNTFRPGRSD